MTRVAVLHNPVAGAGRAARIAERAGRLLEERGATVERLVTAGPGGAEVLAREWASRIDLLVVAGGDGTIREALTGLGDERRRVTLAVLPCGNANVVARELGIPLHEDGALEVLGRGEPRSIDLGIANGDLFLAVVGVGWDARTVHHLSRLRRSRLGGRWYRLWADSVYFVAGILALFTWPPARVRLVVDGRVTGRRYPAVVVANFRCYGKGWAMVPDADCASGRLHYQARRRSGPVFVFWQLVAAMRRRRTPGFVSDHGQGREIAVEGERPFAVQVDGDDRGTTTRLELRVDPRAALMLAASPTRADPRVPVTEGGGSRRKLPAMPYFTRYQWTVLFAAWLGWGFDVFDGLLFNYVAPNCVPTLLGLPLGSPEAKHATLYWTGLLTSLLLIGWAAGGVLFGMVCDRIGRTRTLLVTMLLYALGTAACAFAPSMGWLVVFRVTASLGIGGEWAAGASMVAESMPEEKRVEAGALLYTAAPMGLFLATFVNMQVAGTWFVDRPETSWRYVFLFGLLPAAAAFVVRLFLEEPERWRETRHPAQARIRELFGPELLPLTRSGFLMALVALLTWWSCNAFIPVISSGLARTAAEVRGLDPSATLVLVEQWKTHATAWFNLGGLIGTLLTIPVAKHLGRRTMFAVYWLASALSIFATFGLDLAPEVRLVLYFAIGVSVFGVFGSFTYYLPELFPTRVRGTGSGFCYNVGRVVAAAGPFAVGTISARGGEASMDVLFWVGLVPLAGLAFMPWVVETRGRPLSD